jgi:hypothetical protein
VHLVVRHVLRAGVPLEGKMLRVLVTVVMPLVALLVTSGLLGTRDLRRSAVVPCAGLGLVSALLFYTLMRGGLLPGLDFGRYLGIGFWLFVASYVGLLGFGLDQRGARRA